MLQELPEELKDFADVFDEERYDMLPEHREWDCKIDFYDDNKLPKPKKAYPLSPKEREATKEYVKSELKSGRIRPSNSPVAASLFFVKKALKPGQEVPDLRPVVDYRGANAETIPDRYPIPLMEQLLEIFKKTSDKSKEELFITSLDLKNGFWNVRIREGDEWKTAFSTSEGLFEYTVMALD
uniref:Reverse transcriptase domain-containing protein n=1 Tax=Globodera pallida TaxID=36090 RepID=A0A183CQJ7_GLOPA